MRTPNVQGNEGWEINNNYCWSVTSQSYFQGNMFFTESIFFKSGLHFNCIQYVRKHSTCMNTFAPCKNNQTVNNETDDEFVL